jgi:hypothetical protein
MTVGEMTAMWRDITENARRVIAATEALGEALRAVALTPGGRLMLKRERGYIRYRRAYLRRALRKLRP